MHNNQAYHHIFFVASQQDAWITAYLSFRVTSCHSPLELARPLHATQRGTPSIKENGRGREISWRHHDRRCSTTMGGAPEFLFSQPLASPKIMRLGIIVVFFHMGGHFIINLVSHAATPSHPKFKVHFFNNLLPSVPVNDWRPRLKGKCTENPWSNPNLLYIIMGEDDSAFSTA